MCLWITQIHPVKENRKYKNPTYAPLELTDPPIYNKLSGIDIKAPVSAIVKQVRKTNVRDISFTIYVFFIFL